MAGGGEDGAGRRKLSSRATPPEQSLPGGAGEEQEPRVSRVRETGGVYGQSGVRETHLGEGESRDKERMEGEFYFYFLMTIRQQY